VQPLHTGRFGCEEVHLDIHPETGEVHRDSFLWTVAAEKISKLLTQLVSLSALAAAVVN